MLGEALSIQEIGPASVASQQTLAFTATLSSARLLKRVLSAKEQRRLYSGKELPDAHFTLEVWLAPSGLPVQTTTTNGKRGEEFSSQEDILALEVPVHVHAPPARQTISQAHWLKLERQHAKAVGRCLRRHPRRMHACIERWAG